MASNLDSVWLPTQLRSPWRRGKEPMTIGSEMFMCNRNHLQLILLGRESSNLGASQLRPPYLCRKICSSKWPCAKSSSMELRGMERNTKTGMAFNTNSWWCHGSHAGITTLKTCWKKVMTKCSKPKHKPQLLRDNNCDL